jgi:predicted phage baseplate assembly protein
LPYFDTVKQQLQITNPVAASGGVAAETLDSAIGRAIELLNATERAVTLRDYEELALHTPGTQLARAKAWANLHPSFPCLKAPGMITLIILPALPIARPTPSHGLRRVVAAYLHHRRIIGTRVEVVGPTYLEVAVRARVRAYTGVSQPSLQQKIVTALNDFLDPLRGGPERTGWPFGRDVYRAEILQVIDEVAGVDHVLSLELVAEGCEPQCGNVCLAPTWLVAAGHHNIEVV